MSAECQQMWSSVLCFGLMRAARLRSCAGSELHSALRERGDGSVATELVVVGGSDLTERKALLKGRAEAFIALPGGSGTWDELWEVVCEKGLGIGVASPPAS